jgi:hypothetical protein
VCQLDKSNNRHGNLEALPNEFDLHVHTVQCTVLKYLTHFVNLKNFCFNDLVNVLNIRLGRIHLRGKINIRMLFSGAWGEDDF